MSDTPRIVKTEDTCGGSPRVDGTRISVPVLLEHIAGYVDLSEIPRTVHRHVTIEDCQQALQYAANVVNQHDSLLAEVVKLRLDNKALTLDRGAYDRVREQRDELTAEVERLRELKANLEAGIYGPNGYDARIASLEADHARLTDRLSKTCKCSYEEGGRCYVCQEYCRWLEAENARLLAHLEEAKLWVTDAATRARMVALCDEVRGAVNNGAVHNVSTESAPEGASVDPATQHCAKCGGVECHALAGLFCGEHPYEGCREWGGCPICVNARLVGEAEKDYAYKRKLEAEIRELKDLNIQGNRLGSWKDLREQNAALVEACESAKEKLVDMHHHDEFCSCTQSGKLCPIAEVLMKLKSALAAAGRGE